MLCTPALQKYRLISRSISQFPTKLAKKKFWLHSLHHHRPKLQNLNTVLVKSPTLDCRQAVTCRPAGPEPQGLGYSSHGHQSQHRHVAGEAGRLASGLGTNVTSQRAASGAVSWWSTVFICLINNCLFKTYTMLRSYFSTSKCAHAPPLWETSSAQALRDITPVWGISFTQWLSLQSLMWTSMNTVWRCM